MEDPDILITAKELKKRKIPVKILVEENGLKPHLKSAQVSGDLAIYVFRDVHRAAIKFVKAMKIDIKTKIYNLIDLLSYATSCRNDKRRRKYQKQWLAQKRAKNKNSF